MKICFITFEYPPFTIGGAGGYAEKLVKELKKRGHSIFVIAPGIKGKEKSADKEQNITRIPIVDKPLLRALSFQLKLKNTFKELERRAGGFDIIHVNGTSDFLINKSSGCPRVVTVHHAIGDILGRISMKLSIAGLSGEGNPVGSYMERTVVSRSNKVIAVSEASRKFLLKNYGLSEDDVAVIYNGIYADDYSFPPHELKAVRSKFGIKDEEKLILCAPARIEDPRKGIVYLLQALPKVFSEVQAKCFITGSGEKKVFDKYLKQIPVAKVQFTGRLDELTKRRLFTACDLFVMPSLLEGCPLSLLEAMAAGVPVVATNAGGIPELMKNNRNGLLAEPRNVKQLADMMIFLLSNQELSKKIGKNNYEDARRFFQWERTASLTEEVYNKALAIAGKAHG